ncbi:SDR family oxidoreductase [Breznakiella homolactica]|uniref:SDR family oxidoreductase n=1 Tax=Breznakiella homolactica TaxID=2798577 RepID=A0A7T7XLF2_9SPIR|nr:SDR family oxidoreductase [Breznakiella homolactica]QQO08427.1 SDR family oxidoreductase [Breznakiella homolactica]
MNVFVTGGTGFIGSLVAGELIRSGHQVLGLARSGEAEQKLKNAGADVLRGELDDIEVLKRGASLTDGVIHMGFSNDFSRYNEAVAMDLAAVQAIGSVLEGTNKPFVNTAGTLGVSGLGRTATEEDHGPEGMPRIASEQETIRLAAKGVRSSVVRLAPCVHDIDRHGLVSILEQIAAEKGFSAYIGEGRNVWPSVHRRDAAHLFCLAFVSAPAGTRLNAVAEEGLPMKDIAKVIGRNLNIPVRGITSEEAQGHFGWFAQSVSLDNPTSSAATKKLLDWTPAHATLFQDIDSFYAKQQG